MPPDSLLVSPCETVGAGRTVRTLSNGYIINTSCADKREVKLRSLQDWKKKQQLIYPNHKEK